MKSVDNSRLHHRLRIGSATLQTDSGDTAPPRHVSKLEVTASDEDDPARAALIDQLRAKRPVSNWREVLGEAKGEGVRREVR